MPAAIDVGGVNRIARVSGERQIYRSRGVGISRFVLDRSAERTALIESEMDVRRKDSRGDRHQIGDRRIPAVIVVFADIAARAGPDFILAPGKPLDAIFA